MKRFLGLLLSMLLLCGCASMPPAETTVPAVSTETTEDPYFAPATTAETESPSKEPTVIPAKLAKHQNSIVVLEANWDIDIFRDSSSSQLNLYILSDQPLSQSDVQADIPVDTAYTVILDEYLRGDSPMTLAEDIGAFVRFSYDTYLSYCDFDWANLAAKYQAMQDILNDPKLSNTPVARQQAYQQAEQEYRQYYETYWNDYLLLNELMIPQFYSYALTILFNTSSIKTDEKFNAVTLTMCGESTTLDIGEVRLHPEKADISTSERTMLLEEYWFGGSTPLPYLNDSLDIAITTLTPKQDIVVTKLDVLQGKLKLGNMNVLITSKKGAASNFIWDGNMSIQVPAGSRIEFSTTIVDSRMAVPGFDFSDMIGIEFEVDGVSHMHCYTQRFFHEPNPFEEYAKYFDGIDFTEYYEKYYYPIVCGIEMQGDT